MKKIIYFIFAILTIIYVGFLCYYNIAEETTKVMEYIAIYGGLLIALMYAAVNFFGNPLKIVFFVLLVLSVIILILTIAIPDVFKNLFGIVSKENVETFINLFK